MQGFCAETGGAITLFMATNLGVPVSTTHTITGSIIGVGAARRVSAVRWNIACRIVFAWVMTIPATALIGALFYWLVGSLHLKSKKAVCNSELFSRESQTIYLRPGGARATRRSARRFSCHARASSAAVDQVGFWARKDGTGADGSMVAIRR